MGAVVGDVVDSIVGAGVDATTLGGIVYILEVGVGSGDNDVLRSFQP